MHWGLIMTVFIIEDLKKHSRVIQKIKVVPTEANISVSQNSSYNS